MDKSLEQMEEQDRMDEREKITQIQEAAKRMRKTMLDMGYGSGLKAHYGGGLSAVDLLAVLYKGILKYDITNHNMIDRDRFIMSKGHGVLGFYAALHEAGFISDEVLKDFQKDESVLGAHPVKNQKLGIESSNGSLGQGLSFAIGSLLAAKRKKIEYRAFVLMGDGECNEGSVWEAAMAGAQYQLDHLIAIIDCNGLQSDGENKNIINMENMAERWKAFGWNAINVDGHNIEELYKVFTHLPNNHKPTVIIAMTIKGKGISFMENNNVWHHEKLSEQQYLQAISEIEG